MIVMESVLSKNTGVELSFGQKVGSSVMASIGEVLAALVVD